MPSLSQILKSKIGSKGKSKTYVASQLGVSEKTVENYMNGKRSPRPEAMVKLAEILGFNLSDLSNETEQNVPLGTLQNVPEQRSVEINVKDKAILNLTETGKKQADALLIAVRNEERLIALVEGKSTADYPRENPLSHPAAQMKLLKYLAELGVGKRWKTVQEGMIELGNMFSLPEDEEQKLRDNGTGSGKKHTAKAKQ